MLKSALTQLMVAGILFAGCSGSKKTNDTASAGSLKEVFKNEFVIGTAINNRQIAESDPGSAILIPQQFNALTPENIMKAELMQPAWGQYNFEMADKLVAYAQKYNMQVNAHTLIWHSQLPSFVRRMKNADSVRMFFTNHINTVAGRYDGKVYSWDVVNEALNEDGTMRKSVFLQNLGENFVTDAFRLAEKAAPNTKLYYNDYNIEQPKKRAGAITIVKNIQAAGVRVDGVGIQGHWHLGKIPLKDIEESILEFSRLGVKVAFTELDIEVLPRNFQGADVAERMQATTSSNQYVNGLPDSVQQQLAKDYEALFNLFLKHKDKIERVTLWGATDAHSWLNDWPVRGRKNYPLLFDREFKPKPAFYKVIATNSK
ncbi:MAG: endo-1,4-beta-xylanase [Bacteroidota bacterium]